MKREIIQANLPIPEPQVVLAELLQAFPDYTGKAYANKILIRRDLIQAEIRISRKQGWNKFEMVHVRLNNSHPSIRIGGTFAVITTFLLLLFGGIGFGIGVVLTFVISLVLLFVGLSQKEAMEELERTLTNYLLQKYDGAIKTMK
jgi:hypothetical protein